MIQNFKNGCSDKISFTAFCAFNHGLIFSSLYKLNEASVSGRELLVLEISTDNMDNGGKRAILKPMVKFVANMHGNEAVGRELTLALARHLLQEYKAGELIRSIEIHNHLKLHFL